MVVNLSRSTYLTKIKNKRYSVCPYFKFFLFALPFLPAYHIPVAFNTLKGKATTQQLQSVMNYIQDTWFDSTVWPVTAWSVLGKSVRTNYDVEGWHNRVNTHAQKSNLHFYLLIELIYKEASKIPLQLKMISEGKLRRRQRKQTKMVQWKILQLWDDYANNKITASHLLKKCGSLYTPGV